MSERKNIDRLFQERFKDFEAEPSEQAWSNIEARLEEKKRRKVIPIWFKYGGVAAVLLVGLLLTMTIGNNSGLQDSNQVVASPDNGAGTKGKDEKGSAEGAASNKKTGDGRFENSRNAVTTIPEKVRKSKNEQRSVERISTENQVVSANPASSGKVGKTGKSKVLPDNTTADDAVAGVKAPKNKVLKDLKHPGSETAVATHETGVKSPGRKAGNRVANGAAIENGGSGQYASATNRKPKKNGKKTSITQQNEAVLFEGSENIAQNRNNDKNINDNLKDKNAIARNENNQSGQPGQHNNPQVTENKTTSTQAITAQSADIKKDSTAIATVEEPNALEELLKNEKENKSVTQSEPKINRWQVASRVAPIYLSSFSNGSPIDSRFAGSEKNYKTNLSYGVGLGYAVSKKLSLRAGVNSVAFEYGTHGVEFSENTFAPSKLQHVNMNLQGSRLNIRAKGTPTDLALGLNGNAVPNFDGSLTQKTSYIEVPLELSYKVLDKRFGVDVIGGFSTFLLNQNEVSLVTSENEMQIGKANNLNDTSFSTNLGIGLRYNILKSLQFNFEPMFKYQINTYSDSGNFKPYFFGLYTGLNYRF